MILNELRKNARISMLDVAKKSNIPLSTVYDKVKDYEGDIIKKHTSIIDFSRVGYLSRMLVALKVTKEARGTIQTFLERHPNVNTLQRVNSGFDYLVEIITQNPVMLKDILEEIEMQNGFIEKKCFDIIDEIKREAFLI